MAKNRTLMGKLAKASAAQTVASPELVAQLRTVIERVTYERTTGKVSIRLRTKPEPRHDAK
jgi:hypothetical protein